MIVNRCRPFDSTRLTCRFAAVVQNRDDRRELAMLRQDLAGNRLDRQRLAELRIDEADLAHTALIGADQHAGNK